MTQRFDEGVKDILAATAIGLGTVPFSANALMKYLDKKEAPIERSAQDSKKEEPKEDTSKHIKVTGKYNQDYYIMNTLVQGGLTKIAAGGIVANLQEESGLDPNARQIVDYKPLKYGKGRGLAQWEIGGRFDTDRINLKDFAKKKGKAWNDLDTQIEFILYELDHHPAFKKVKAKLNKAKTEEEAAKIFVYEYERAGKPNLTKRLKFASNIRDKY